MLDAWVAGFGPYLPWLALIGAGLLVLMMPLPGRGPSSGRRDVWRGFKFAPRRAVLDRAGGRCEGAVLVFGLRCPDPAVEVDHVYPWSKGGPTVVSNGQALCKGHNRSKSAMTPPWWYLLTLERRRRRYFPPGVDVRVHAVMSSEEATAREMWSRGRRSR